MTIISPSLLSCDFLNIEKELGHFSKVKDIWFHLDIMDGHFVPNLTFGNPIIKKIVEHTDIPCDAHFMVTNPEFYIESLKDISLHNFTFHYEACDNPLQMIKKAKPHFSSVGVSIKPHTETDVLTPEILKELDLVLIMSVEPGFGGQKFLPSALAKIEKLVQIKKDYKLDFMIQVDGGVNEQTAKELRKSGAENLVAGSYIFKADAQKYLERIESLRS